MNVKLKRNLYIALIVILLLSIAAVALVWVINRDDDAAVAEKIPEIAVEPDVTVVYRDVEKFVEVEKVITAATIQDGLRSMGVLITQEYFFTDVISYSSAKQAFGMSIPFTESNFIVSYDGEVEAGLDFSEITVIKDDELKELKIFLPKSEINNISIDFDSLKVYSEKNGWGNPVKIEDYNTSLSELEKNACNKAVEKGLLIKADENARQVIMNFVSSMVDCSEYRVTVQNTEV